VRWTRIFVKNAAGETVVDETTGRDNQNHEFSR